MPDELLLEELETSDPVEENLAKVEVALRSARSELNSIIDLLLKKQLATTFADVWQKTVLNVAKGLTAEMHARRPRLIGIFDNWFGLLTKANTLLTKLRDQDGADLPDPAALASAIAGMERLKSSVFDRWHSAEDLEHLAVRDYPLTTADLNRILPYRQPPASWYAEEGKPF